MMKSKPVTFLLLAATLFVWGLIVWKIVRKPPEEEVKQVSEPAPVPRKKDPRDTLWLEYRDPFLGHYEVAQPETEIEEPVYQFDIPVPVYAVLYHGRIVKNRVENCIIEINGEQFTMRQGMTQDGFRLNRVYVDSVRIEKDGHVFTVNLSQ